MNSIINWQGVKRICFDIFFFFSVFFFPWWLILLVGIIASFLLPSFFEVIVIGLLLDLIASTPLPSYFGFQFMCTTAALFLFFFSGQLKIRLRT